MMVPQFPYYRSRSFSLVYASQNTGGRPSDQEVEQRTVWRAIAIIYMLFAVLLESLFPPALA